VSKIGAMILTMCGEADTSYMILNTMHIAHIAAKCGCFMQDVRQYATKLGVKVIA
jgi:hypothetical protein